jgi:GNAT superfamily N-acetyltransferase
VRATFSVFADKLAAEGFAFLDARIREHGGTGPVLTCQREGKITGVIGPMDVMPDSQGAARLLSQYFGVLPEYRGLGLGRSLWRAAMPRLQDGDGERGYRAGRGTPPRGPRSHTGARLTARGLLAFRPVAGMPRFRA